MALSRPGRPTIILRTLFWGAAIFAFIMAILPKPPVLPADPPDKVLHIIAFLTLAALAGRAYPRTSLVRLGGALSGFGALIEIVQAIPVLNRDPELLDWAADSTAAALVLALFGIVRASRPKGGKWRE